MYKRIFALISVILCFSVLCGCSNPSASTDTPTTSPTTGTNNAATSPSTNISGTNSTDTLKVIRYPYLGDTQDSDYSAYYEAGLSTLYPSRNVDSKLVGSTKKIILNNKEYSVDYARSYVHSEDAANSLKKSNYDVFCTANNEVVFEVYKGTGVVKKVSILRSELDGADKIISDFSEASLKSAAESILIDLNGASFSQYLNNYYRFEYADLFEYFNNELNKYVVCYRAYLNGIPTDDILYVHFSPKGAFKAISAKKCLQYIDINEASLVPIDKLEVAIRDALNKLNYSTVRLLDEKHNCPCYYTMSSKGELYYVMEWDVSKTSGNSALGWVEKLAVKAG